MPGAGDDVVRHEVKEARDDIDRLYERTDPIREQGNRLESVEDNQKIANKQRGEDRIEFLSEIKELRRTIIQATLAILVAMMAAIVTFSQIAGGGTP